MSDTPWTPGPWWADLETGEIVRQENVLCLIAEGVSQVEDARLIAAAPDMAEALEEISAALHQIARDRDLWETELAFMRRVDAALAKARGQS